MAIALLVLPTFVVAAYVGMGGLAVLLATNMLIAAFLIDATTQFCPLDCGVLLVLLYGQSGNGG